MSTLGRRAFLVAEVAALASACSGAPRSRSDDAPTQPTTSPEPTSPSAPVLPPRTRWRPGPGELVPEAKLAAVRRVEWLGNGPTRRLSVIDAQYGGLLSTTASVLVVSRSVALRGGGLVGGGHTFDVRLSLVGDRWTVTAVHPSHPGPPTPTPTTAVRHVLRSSGIDLPPAARSDVASGKVHDSVLEAMLAVSRRWPIGVSVVRTGHPLHVFGTDRLSDHPRGLAFDTWRVDGHPVVRPSTPRALVTGYMEALVAAGGDNVGGPVQLGGAAYFSDRTHHDHVHAGFPG